jgi:deoxycytidine triphosphate deaminase
MKRPDPPEQDPLANNVGSVLLSDQIQFYIDHLDPPLIENFDPDNLKPARYNLRLGADAHVEGERKTLDDKTPLILKPHQVAVVQTFESINLPRFLIGRWNLIS